MDKQDSGIDFQSITSQLIQEFDEELNLSFNQIEEAAKETFSFGKRTYPYGNLKSGASICIYQWVRSLADATIEDNEKLHLIEEFRQNLLKQHYVLGLPPNLSSQRNVQSPQGKANGVVDSKPTSIGSTSPKPIFQLDTADWVKIVVAVIGALGLVLAALIQGGVFK